MKHVVFLHGLGSHGLTMSYLKRYFDINSEYKTHVISYRSLDSSIEGISNYIISEINRLFLSSDYVCLVGHSLGGLIARKVSRSQLITCRIGKIVTLGTPHNGAILATKILDKFSILNLLPIIEELSYKSKSINDLGHTSSDVGVIIGNRITTKWNPLMCLGKLILDNESVHDGVVMMRENILGEARDTICLHVDHFNMLWSEAVARQSLHFINTGKFK